MGYREIVGYTTNIDPLIFSEHAAANATVGQPWGFHLQQLAVPNSPWYVGG
jgi:hypothetical protein